MRSTKRSYGIEFEPCRSVDPVCADPHCTLARESRIEWTRLDLDFPDIGRLGPEQVKEGAGAAGAAHPSVSAV